MLKLLDITKCHITDAQLEDTRRELISKVLENGKAMPDDELIGRLMDKCDCSFRDACELLDLFRKELQ